VVGLGTGSTVRHTILALGEMVRGGFEVLGVPTSKATEALALDQGIPLTTLDDHPLVDVAVDGADEVAPNLDLTKGMGGALVRERIVASAAREFIVVVDEGKLVEVLASRSPLPVEVLPFGWSATSRRIEALGARVERWEAQGRPFPSDNGNYILHCHFRTLPDPRAIAEALDGMPGVVDHGLFLGMASRVIVGGSEGTRELTRGRP
jgi:ribose 5-phosphate isomerase A